MRIEKGYYPVAVYFFFLFLNFMCLRAKQFYSLWLALIIVKYTIFVLEINTLNINN
jgi:uncharacterized membrane protein